MNEREGRWTEISRQVVARMKVLRIPDQAELRRLSGLSQPTAKQYMTGVGRSETPRARQAQMLADALSWPADWWDRIGAGEDLTEWATSAPFNRPDADEAARIQIDAALAAIDASLRGLEERFARRERQLDQMQQRLDSQDGPPARRAPKPAR